MSVHRSWDDLLGGPSGRQQLEEGPQALLLAQGHTALFQPSGEPAEPRVWLVPIGGHEGSPLHLLEEILTSAFASMAAHAAQPDTGRSRRLVAMPVLGVRHGGYQVRRGEVIRELLRVAGEACRTWGFDVAIVAQDPADRAALQAERRKTWDPVERWPDLVELGRLARQGRLALFMGAGTGISAGLPTWTELLRKLKKRLKLAVDDEELRALGPLDAAEFLSRRVPEGQALGDLVAELIGKPVHYAMAHALLAAIGCREAITTNFDDLYERAVEAAWLGRPLTVLPASAADEMQDMARHGADGWLLKLHGEVKRPESIVLDRRSFVTFDAGRRPLGGVLQTVLLTRHLLVVGASLADDNVIRLIHEVNAIGGAVAASRRYGTVLSLGDDRLRGQLWEPEFTFVDVGEGSASLPDAARQLEIFLDALSMLATTEASYLLDERYRHLLDEEEQATAGLAQQLITRLQLSHSGMDHESGWTILKRALEELGARPGGTQLDRAREKPPLRHPEGER